MAARLIPAYQTFHSSNGVSPLNGGKLHFYVAGTVSTDKDTFSDNTLLTANPNPIVLDSAGRIPNTVIDVWGDGNYDLVVADSSDVEITRFDNISGSLFQQAVNTIAELTALLKTNLTTGDQVDVSGHSAQGDGGGSPLFWNSTSTTTVNGITVYASDEGGAGRWTRILQYPPTTKMAGLAADGTVGDVAKLDLALAAVDDLIFTAGTYPPYVFSQSNKTISFEEGVVFKLPDGTMDGTDTVPVITVKVTGTDVTFNGNLVVNGNVANNGFASINPSANFGAVHIAATDTIINDTVRIINANWMSLTAGSETDAAVNGYINHLDVENSQHYATSFWDVDKFVVGSISNTNGGDTNDARVRTGSQNSSVKNCSHLSIAQIVTDGAVVNEARTLECVIDTIDASVWKAEDCDQVTVGNMRLFGSTSLGFSWAIQQCTSIQLGSVSIHGHNGAADVVARVSDIDNVQIGHFEVIGTINDATDFNLRGADGLVITSMILRDPIGNGRGFHFDSDAGFLPQEKIRIGSLISTGHTGDVDVLIESVNTTDIEFGSINEDATGVSAIPFIALKEEFEVSFGTGGGTVTVNPAINLLSVTKDPGSRKVTINGQVEVSAVSLPTGTLTLGPLPVTSLAGNEKSTECAVTVRPTLLNASAWTGALTGSIAGGSNTITLVGYDGSTAFDVAEFCRIGTKFTFDITYFV